MDPQENTTPAVPDRPLTRRELRERERARQEAQQRMLAPQRRAYAPPPSAFPRTAAEPTPPAPPATPSPAAAAALSGAHTPAGANRERGTGQGRRRGSFSAAPAPQASPASERRPGEASGVHDGAGARPEAPRAEAPAPEAAWPEARAESPRPEAPSWLAAPGRPSGDGGPTASSMGWGTYPPSSGPSALVVASPIAAADAVPSAALPEPRPAWDASGFLSPATVPATETEADPGYDDPGALHHDQPVTHSDQPVRHSDPGPVQDDPVPAEPAAPATAFFPSVPESAPATMPVGRVAPSEQQGVRRGTFPLAAQAYARGHAPAPEQDRFEAPADPAGADWHPDSAQEHDDVHGHGALLAPEHDVHDPHGHLYEEHHDVHHDVDHAVFGEPVVARAPSKGSRRLRVLVGLGLAIALFVGASLIAVEFLKPVLGIGKVTDYPGPGSGSVTVTVQAGSGPAAVASSLEKQGVVADANTFLKAFAATGGSLHPGDYTFKKEMPSADAAQILAGTSGGKVIYLALNAGLRVSESLDEIAKAASVDRKELDALNAKPAQFGLPPQAKNLEGYLAPGEYRLPVGSSAKDVLTKLVSTTVDELTQAGVTDPSKQYDVLTVASIVQAEGGRADYGNVAGAIYNRLKPNPETNGLIQSDATVTYGLGRKSYHITEQEKADGSNPYNTYQHTGLPAGPIGSPGKTAIDAAAKPTPNDFLYWVTVNLDTGETKFSKTYAEHLGYAQQYEQWCQANPGKCK